MAAEIPPDAPEPRLCHLLKWPDFDGYGFNLHAEKAKCGQFIGKVDDASPAQLAGLHEGDRIIEVNGVNIANENHRQVVERIKAVSGETKLLVVDEAGDKWFKERKLVIKSSQSNVRVMKTPSSRPTTGTESSEVAPGQTSSNAEPETNSTEGETAVSKNNKHVSGQSATMQQRNDSSDNSVRTSPTLQQRNNNHINNNNNNDDKQVEADSQVTEEADHPSAGSSRSTTPNGTIIPEEPKAKRSEAIINQSNKTNGNGSPVSNGRSAPIALGAILVAPPPPPPPPPSQTMKMPVLEVVVKSAIKNGRSGSGGSLNSAESLGSSPVPASPASTKSAASSGMATSSPLPPSQTMSMTPTPPGSTAGDLNLNMSVSEMRQMLAQKKKHDAKKAQLDLRQKYEIIQQM